MIFRSMGDFDLDLPKRKGGILSSCGVAKTCQKRGFYGEREPKTGVWADALSGVQRQSHWSGVSGFPWSRESHLAF